MKKRQLRQKMKEKLKKLSPTEKNKIEQKLFQQLVTSKLWKHANIIGTTISQSYEWNTEPVIRTAWEDGKTVAIPKSIPEKKKLKYYHFKSYDQLEVAHYNLLEPKPRDSERIKKCMIDLLIVPGLLFDKKGFRIGFGGGYFDRFLINFPNISVSLVSTIQLIEHVPSEVFDIPVNHLITEDGILK